MGQNRDQRDMGRDRNEKETGEPIQLNDEKQKDQRSGQQHQGGGQHEKGGGQHQQGGQQQGGGQHQQGGQQQGGGQHQQGGQQPNRPAQGKPEDKQQKPA